MKVLIPILIGLLVVGCGEIMQTAIEEPVMDLSIKEEVGGTYELKSSTRHLGKMVRFVFADNGAVEEFVNGEKGNEYDLGGMQPEVSIMHTANQSILFFRKNPDGSLTHIAYKDPYRRPQIESLRTNYKKSNSSCTILSSRKPNIY